MQLTRYSPPSSFNSGGEEEKEPDLKKANPTTMSAMSVINAIMKVLAPLFTLLLVAASFVALGLFSGKDPTYTNQFLVLTGQRTRDLKSLNSYSMQMVLGDDPKTRLYLCMMQAGIGQGEQDCPKSTSVVGFRDCLKSIKKDCGAFSDGGLPRDGGFLQCIGSTFKTTPTMINRFVQCEDLAESIMVDSVQTPYSKLFLGSYNFASLLISAVAVMASFMVFTTGGHYAGGEIETSSNFHISGMFFPMATLVTWVAMIWSLIFAVIAYAYSFPMDCDNALCITKANAYPTTPWTGKLCMGVFLGLSGYYASFIFEKYFDKTNKVVPADESKTETADVMDPSTNGFNSYSQKTLPQGYPVDQTSSFSSSGSGSSRYSSFNQDYGQTPNNSWSYPSGAGQRTDFASKLNFSRPTRYHRLGVKLHSGTASVKGEEAKELFPLMVEAFAWTFIFVDGILFLGMINSQNSPLHENVATMFASITACRILQLAVAKFMNEAFVAKIDGKTPGWRQTIDPRQFGIQVTLIFTYVASPGLLLIALYNFMNANSLLSTFSSQVNSPSYAISIFFLLTVGILPEVVRIIQFAVFSARDVEASTILFWTELLFMWNWLFRFVLIVVALFRVPEHLKEQSDAVMNFVGIMQ
jgi:hypothetical protein